MFKNRYKVCFYRLKNNPEYLFGSSYDLELHYDVPFDTLEDAVNFVAQNKTWEVLITDPNLSLDEEKRQRWSRTKKFAVSIYDEKAMRFVNLDDSIHGYVRKNRWWRRRWRYYDNGFRVRLAYRRYREKEIDKQAQTV